MVVKILIICVSIFILWILPFTLFVRVSKSIRNNVEYSLWYKREYAQFMLESIGESMIASEGIHSLDEDVVFKKNIKYLIKYIEKHRKIRFLDKVKYIVRAKGVAGLIRIRPKNMYFAESSQLPEVGNIYHKLGIFIRDNSSDIFKLVCGDREYSQKYIDIEKLFEEGRLSVRTDPPRGAALDVHNLLFCLRYSVQPWQSSASWVLAIGASFLSASIGSIWILIFFGGVDVSALLVGFLKFIAIDSNDNKSVVLTYFFFYLLLGTFTYLPYVIFEKSSSLLTSGFIDEYVLQMLHRIYFTFGIVLRFHAALFIPLIMSKNELLKSHEIIAIVFAISLPALVAVRIYFDIGQDIATIESWRLDYLEERRAKFS